MIRAQMDADANAGVAPGEPDYIDQTVGGFYYDLTQSPGLEIERLWDFLSMEVISAMFPAFAWGRYLDYWGDTLNLPRNPSATAVGEVVIVADDATAIPTGTVVAVPQTDPDA